MRVSSTVIDGGPGSLSSLPERKNGSCPGSATVMAQKAPCGSGSPWKSATPFWTGTLLNVLPMLPAPSTKKKVACWPVAGGEPAGPMMAIGTCCVRVPPVTPGRGLRVGPGHSRIRPS